MFQSILSKHYKTLCGLVLLMSTLISVQTAFATVGGDDGFTILGFEARDDKVYFAIHDGDGSGFVDSIHYFNLKQTPSKAVFAKSLYTKGNIADCTGSPVCEKILNNKVKAIQKRLIPLAEYHSDKLSMEILQQTTKSIPWYGDPDYPTPEHNTKYQVVFDDGKTRLAGQGHVTYYRDQIKIAHAYKIPRRTAMLVVVEYLGKPYEFGYKMYDMVLLKPKRR